MRKIYDKILCRLWPHWDRSPLYALLILLIMITLIWLIGMWAEQDAAPVEIIGIGHTMAV